MNNPPAEIIHALLLEEELIEAGDSFIGFFPDDPDDAVCVYDSVARPDGRIMRTGERIEHPGIHIDIRGLDYQETFRRASAIALALDGVRNVSVAVETDASYIVRNVSRTGGVLSTGIDTVNSRRRHYFSINATITVESE